jgi:hypothetical protein
MKLILMFHASTVITVNFTVLVSKAFTGGDVDLSKTLLIRSNTLFLEFCSMVAPQYGEGTAYSDLSIGYRLGWSTKSTPWEVIDTELVYNHMISQFVDEKDRRQVEAAALAAGLKGKKKAAAQTSRALKIDLMDVRTPERIKVCNIK